MEFFYCFLFFFLVSDLFSDLARSYIEITGAVHIAYCVCLIDIPRHVPYISYRSTVLYTSVKETLDNHSLQITLLICVVSTTQIISVNEIFRDRLRVSMTIVIEVLCDSLIVR
jgi:hypothetical protein